MKVQEKFQPQNFNRNNIGKLNAGRNKSVNFGNKENIARVLTGNLSNAAKSSRLATEAKAIEQGVAREMGIPGSVMRYFYNKLGAGASEMGGIVFNTIGTAFVAPAFIAWNPLSDTDQKTKTYTAMRQPISAVLAFITQISITQYSSNYFQQWASNGQLGKSMDLTIKPCKGYLERQVSDYAKKRTCAFQEDGPNKDLLGILKEKLDKKPKGKIDAATINEIVTAMQKERKTAVLNEVAERIKIKDLDYIDVLAERANYQRFQNIIDHGVCTDGTGLKPENSLEDVRKITEDIVKFEENIRKLEHPTLNGDYVKNPAIEAAVDAVTNIAAKQAKENLAITGVLNPDLKDAANMASFKRKMKESIWQYINNDIKGEAVGDISKNGVRIFKQDAKTFLKTLKEQATKFLVTEAAEFKIKKNEHAFNGFGLVAGMILSLATIIPTSYVLNWVYPRFMEKVFPNLSAAKKASVAKKMGQEGK